MPNASNVLLSYNNKPVTEAIPIPGLVETLPGTQACKRVRNERKIC